MTRTWKGLWIVGTVALLVLQIVDIGTTVYGLSHGAREVGAIAGPLGAGPMVLLAVPVVGTVLQLAVIYLAPPRARPLAWAAVLGVTVYLLVENVAVITGL